jgi:hypothetical protein
VRSNENKSPSEKNMLDLWLAKYANAVFWAQLKLVADE